MHDLLRPYWTHSHLRETCPDRLRHKRRASSPPCRLSFSFSLLFVHNHTTPTMVLPSPSRPRPPKQSTTDQCQALPTNVPPTSAKSYHCRQTTTAASPQHHRQSTTAATTAPHLLLSPQHHSRPSTTECQALPTHVALPR